MVKFGILDTEEIIINPRELERRLGCPAATLEKVQGLAGCEAALRRETVCRYAFVRLPVGIPAGGLCVFGDAGESGGFSIESADLAKNLAGCREAVVMGVTLGPGVDRLLKRLGLTSKADHFITDALASALAEAAADEVEKLARESICEAESGRSGCPENEAGLCFRPRYSPGYGDCSIENQRAVLAALEGEKHLGISLNDRCFMNPLKSVTAVMGVKKVE